ncbi:MAG: OmpH family outer membrane protein [Bacteroidetes bacterium]|nr:OmpH family outer membrane protein [Bacteroidota bacterium]
MKKLTLILALSFAVISCNKSSENVAPSKDFKTAYVDTSKLMEEYQKAKDIEKKYKDKSDQMGKELQAEVAKFKSEAANFQKNAQANGQAWAQTNGARLQKKEQELSYAQDAMLRQLQEESGVEMDSLVSNVKKYIKKYGKEKGYDYVFASGDTNVSILYAKEQYDITKEMIKLLNEEYASEDKKEAKK